VVLAVNKWDAVDAHISAELPQRSIETRLGFLNLA
jgi:predicted GTPase